MAAGFKLRRLHLRVPGPDGGWFPWRVAERRARALTDAGELRPALQAFELNTGWADRSGDDGAAAGAHLALAIHLMMMVQLDPAVEHLDRAATLFEALGDQAQLRTVSLWRSKVCSSRGQFDQALEMLEQLERSLPPDDAAMAVSVAVFRGNVHFWKGEFDQALASFQRQLDDARRRGKKETELIALINIG
ncbi:MAG TPA: hypothetical protein VMF29_08825, partial [Candidatus Edwardsbacteria bacterium]|nr:hypothetical protein [Candidatus Edwardsbacteria bacterium]